jgi:hypothetical protein
VAKRLKTYRIDAELDDAVTAKATREGETVTNVIMRALREYAAGNPPARKPPRSRAARTGQAPEPCPHRLPPGAYCKTCDKTT